MEPWQGLIHRYRAYLPVSDSTPVVSLCEGNTPLVRAGNLKAHIPQDIDIYLKLDGANPTGSFKDRGMTMAITKAKEAGSRAVICASTGNTSASAAAYAARAGMAAIVLIPEGKIALGKLAQAMIHGAKVFQIDGNFDDALNIVKSVVEKMPITLVNSINPYRIDGQKTAAFEICDALGGAPEYHALPVGNAGNITAYWKGYNEYMADGVTSFRPVMLGFQAAGAAPIVLGHKVDKPETVATAIRIGNPASWKQAVAARDESGGIIDSVTDDEILAAYAKIAASEGIFCEPASAASVAGVMKLAGKGYFKPGSRVVCTLTGHGLKDPDNAIRNSPPPVRVKASAEVVMGMLEDVVRG